MKEANAGLQRNQPIKMALKTIRHCSVWSCEKLSLQCLPSDPNIRKEWINFIFNEDPDRISKNSVLCSLHFTADSFTNETFRHRIFREIEKERDNAVSTLLDPTVILQHTSVSNCFYYVITIVLSVITERLICTEQLCIFNLNHISTHLWMI